MSISEELKKVRAKLKFMLCTNGKQPVFVNIPSIPSEWETFPNSNDRWVRIDLPISEQATSCIYEAKEGSVLVPHFHYSSELVTILTPGTSMVAMTNEYCRPLKYGDSHEFKSEEVHAVKFNNDMKVQIIWRPAFKDGWDATYIDQND